MCNFVPRLEHKFDLSFFKNTGPFLICKKSFTQQLNFWFILHQKVKQLLYLFLKQNCWYTFIFCTNFHVSTCFLYKSKQIWFKMMLTKIVLCCLHTSMGGKSQKISSLFVQLENWCLFFHDTAFWVNRISILFSSMHYFQSSLRNKIYQT